MNKLQSSACKVPHPKTAVNNGNTPAVPRVRTGGRSAQVREKVLGATLDILVEDGLHALSIESVATRSGVHKTTIYRRWGNCSKLVVEAVQQVENAIAPIPDTGDLKSDLHALANAYAAFFSSEKAVAMGRLIVSSRGADHDLGHWMDEYWRERLSVYEVVLNRAVERGELQGTDEEMLTLTLEMLIGPITMRALLTNQPSDGKFIYHLAESVYLYITRRDAGCS
jgi:AcrR family transcriptional regulator